MSSPCAVLTNHFQIPTPLQHLPRVDLITTEFDIYVVPGAQGIGVLIPVLAKKPYYVDFASQQMRYRSAQAKQHNELIVRACKIKSLDRPCRVLDATAGLGRDAFILAASGFTVSLIERHPVVAVLLEQGIARITDIEIKTRLKLVHADSQDYLKKWAEANDKPDVVYLDPMFAIKRQAKVKKDLQMLQSLLRDVPDDSQDLLPCALQAADKRVVVKRAIDAAPLNACKPAFSFSGKQARFDVYLP